MTLINYLLQSKKTERTDTAGRVGLMNKVNSHSYRKGFYSGCRVTEIKQEVQSLAEMTPQSISLCKHLTWL